MLDIKKLLKEFFEDEKNNKVINDEKTKYNK